MAKKQNTKVLEDTPLLKQFFSIKAQYPDVILLYRVGDFYETYSDDADIASKVLGIVETKKSNGAKGDVAMAGFPHHSINVYLPKLVRAGYKVAVCDQLEDPKKTKTLVKRGVTELVTPGIAYNEEILDQKTNNFLCGLYFQKDLCGIAFLDVTTGTFKLSQGGFEYIQTLLQSMNPKELVVPGNKAKFVCEKLGSSFYISTMDEWAFVQDSAEDRLKKQFNTESLKGFAINKYPLGICAAGALLAYLERTHHTDLKNICAISRIDQDKFVWMDEFTFKNLEIFQASAGGEGTSLIDVLDNCASPMGARLLRSYLAMPVIDIKELNRRYSVVRHFINNKEDLADLRTYINSIGDLERIISRAATGKIVPREIKQMSRGMAQNAPISALCSHRDVPELDNLVAQMKDCTDVIELINKTLCEEPAASIGKGKVIADGVDERLDEYRDIAKNGKTRLLEIQKREIENTGIPSLKISFNSVFGYYLEVRNTHKDKVPEGWIRKQTLVSSERYITEELKEYEAKILSAEENIIRLEEEAYMNLVRNIQNHIYDIQVNCDITSRLDVLGCFALNAINHNYCEPEMTEGYEIDIKAGRHPVIETLMPIGEEYIANDVFIDNQTQQVIILTGPNMSGKSALLRQTALIVLMAQIGSFVPAQSAKIGFCDKIFTRVGASDNISRGESTFMVEMLETSMILHNVSSRSLILLDEIGRGTSTYDGMSIARAIVEYIHEYGKGAKTLFATHYHELNDLENIYPRVKNYHIEVKESNKEIIFLRVLKPGGVAHSFGIHVARMAGMPEQVLSSAEATLNRLEERDSNMRNLEINQMEGFKKTQKKDFSGEANLYKPEIAADEQENYSKFGTVEDDGSIQLSLFQLDDPTLSAIKKQLEVADINNMTPLQAFDLIRSMKDELGLK